MNGIGHGSKWKICGPRLSVQMRCPKGSEVLRLMISMRLDTRPMSAAMERTFCRGRERTRESRVVAKADRNNSVSGGRKVAGGEPEAIKTNVVPKESRKTRNTTR